MQSTTSEAGKQTGVAGKHPRYSGADLLAAVVFRLLRKKRAPRQITTEVSRATQDRKIRAGRPVTGCLVQLCRYCPSAWQVHLTTRSTLGIRLEYLHLTGRIFRLVWLRPVVGEAQRILREVA